MSQCEQQVPDPGTWSRYHQCSRKAKKDGYCAQHHPDAKAARTAKADAKWQEKQDARYAQHDALAIVNNPDNVIITRADLRELLASAEFIAKELEERMETKLKEGLNA